MFHSVPPSGGLIVRAAVDVVAGAEGGAVGAQDRDLERVVIGDDVERVEEVIEQGVVERVALLGPIHRDGCDRPIGLELDRGVGHRELLRRCAVGERSNMHDITKVPNMRWRSAS